MKLLIHEQIIDGVVRPIRLSEPEIYADREAEGRSGHVGHGLCEFAPGKIIDFAENTSNVRFKGHSSFGYTEYRISEDYGKTFGEVKILPYSYQTLMDGIYTIDVEKAVGGADGSITAVCLRCTQSHEICCEPWDTPMIIRSEDGGETWSEPYELCPYKGRTYDAVRYGDAILILHFCNEGVDCVEGIEGFAGSAPEHVYRLFRSDDNGKSFYEQCVVPFPDTFGRAYGNLIVRKDGSMIAYAYNQKDQYNMDYVISPDGGKTWTEHGRSHVAKRIRNPQVGLLDGQYILHGRAGENEAGSGAFVFYTSADGIVWDEGKILVEGRPACFYSNNLTVRTPDGKERMLVQYSENYNDPRPGTWWSAQVNIMHLWVESV